MKSEFLKKKPHGDNFPAGAFFAVVVLTTVLLAGVASLLLRQFGAEALLLEYHAVVWLLSLVASLFSTTLFFDHLDRKH